MQTSDFAAGLMKGVATYTSKEEDIDKIPWGPHPKFKGISMKHLVKGADTEGRMSCHIVKLDPNAILDEHTHDKQWELHEVIEGEGAFFLAAKEKPYHTGDLGIIPSGVKHKVVAGKDGIVLTAVFFPALL
jgi:quercetin dioxygenase-like cupin family protein